MGWLLAWLTCCQASSLALRRVVCRQSLGRKKNIALAPSFALPSYFKTPLTPSPSCPPGGIRGARLDSAPLRTMPLRLRLRVVVLRFANFVYRNRVLFYSSLFLFLLALRDFLFSSHFVIRSADFILFFSYVLALRVFLFTLFHSLCEFFLFCTIQDSIPWIG